MASTVKKSYQENTTAEPASWENERPLPMCSDRFWVSFSFPKRVTIALSIAMSETTHPTNLVTLLFFRFGSLFRNILKSRIALRFDGTFKQQETN